MWSELRRLRGALLVLVLAVATIWLAATGRLALYIHPRYDVFTVVMASIAVVACVAAIGAALRRARRASAPLREHRADLLSRHDRDHEHDHDDVATRAGRVLGGVAIAISAALAIAIIALPPATLSSATAIQRDISSDAVLDPEADAAALAAATGASTESFAALTVRDWAALLRQTSDPSFYAGKPVDVIGFVTEHPDDPGLFYVSRFSITCCAVDAQPFGVPVALTGWADSVEPDGWVRVTGEFVSAGASAGAAIVLDPTEVTAVDEPDQPYLF